jgi:hypothetical protein
MFGNRKKQGKKYKETKTLGVKNGKARKKKERDKDEGMEKAD